MSDRALDELKSVMSFCTDFGCRRKRLLRYFQETVEMMISRYPQMKPRDRQNCCDYCRVGKGGILDVERVPVAERVGGDEKEPISEHCPGDPGAVARHRREFQGRRRGTCRRNSARFGAGGAVGAERALFFDIPAVTGHQASRPPSRRNARAFRCP